MLTSGRYTVSRREIETEWSFEDLCVALDTMAMLSDAEHDASEEARRQAESARR